MKFHKLEVKNFLTLQSGNIHLNDRGLNVIQGVNDDDTSASSNGAGKSSLVDALCWVLFGTTARGVKGDAVVNVTAKKDCSVMVQMSNGDSVYYITRFRKHKENKNALIVKLVTDDGGTVADLSKGTDSETQKEVERILGCSHEVFMAAVYSGQEVMPDLPKMTDRELKRLIEEAAGLERIERAYEESRIRRSAIVSKMDSLGVKRESAKTRIARDESNLMIKSGEEGRFEDERVERVAAARVNHDTLKEKLVTLTAALVKEKPEIDSAAAEIASLSEQLAAHSKLNVAARNAEDTALRAEMGIDRSLLASTRSTVATIQGQIDNVDAEMAIPCSECDKPHTEADREDYLVHRTKRLNDAKQNLALVQDKVRGQVEEVKRLREVAKVSREAVPDVSEVNRIRADLDKKVSDYSRRVTDARTLKGHVDAAASALAMRESEPNPSAAVVASLRESIAVEAATLAELATKHAELVQELEVADAVVKVFGPSGVRAHILDTVTPFLNERTADYLSALSDGAIQATWSTLTKSASGDLKEKFSIDVNHLKGGDSFLSLSGGEKRKVRLCTALALQDLVASRATQPIDLFVGDEIDDALDAAGLERLMVILERRARERGTVLVISHNSLSDWCDQITTVKKSGGVSTVEGALCV
jgi:DNA repair exonuclease SbcCD ATPase subunit